MKEGNINSEAPWEQQSLASISDWDDLLVVDLNEEVEDVVISERFPNKVCKQIVNLDTTTEAVIVFNTKSNPVPFPLQPGVPCGKLPRVVSIDASESTKVKVGLYVQDIE